MGEITNPVRWYYSDHEDTEWWHRGGETRNEAIELWKSVLTNPAPRMLDALVAGPLTKEGIGMAIGAAPRGGNFNNGLSQLRRNGLVQEYGSGTLRLAEPLPGEGA